MTQVAVGPETKKTLAEVDLDRLVGLYEAVAEGYGIALMMQDEELVERTEKWLDQLSQAIEEASR